MSTFTFAPENNEYRLKFGYDEGIIDLVRAIPGRRWNARQKRWFIPISQRPALLAAEKELMRKLYAAIEES